MKIEISEQAWCRHCVHHDDMGFCLTLCNQWYLGRPIAYCDKEKGCSTCNRQVKARNYCNKQAWYEKKQTD